jgi:hypothetical protein
MVDQRLEYIASGAFAPTGARTYFRSASIS